MKNLVVLTGAGISAESGLKTFRDMGGIWEQYNVYEVASPEAWNSNPELVLRFYNERRKQLLETKPNAAHKLIAKLQNNYDVTVITQNVDDLHERAGTKKVLHLHGELRKARSTCDENKIYDIEGWELKLGDTDDNGCQLRPHVVWFGESVPMLHKAVEITTQAEIFVIIGTSLNVYPAASLIDYVKQGIPIFYIDPNPASIYRKDVIIIPEKATTGVKRLIDEHL
jgi:NAD-dependent deacetylase